MRLRLGILVALTALALSVSVILWGPGTESGPQAALPSRTLDDIERAGGEGDSRQGIPPDPVRTHAYLDLDEALGFDLSLCVQFFLVENGKNTHTIRQEWTLETRLRGVPSAGHGALSVDSMRRGVDMPSERRGLPETVPSRELSFSLDSLGHVSGITLEPDADGYTRSFIRSLTRIHVPSVLAGESETQWRWRSAPLDLIGEMARARWQPGEAESTRQYDIASGWQLFELEGGKEPWPLLDIQDFEAFPFDDVDVSRIYRASFLLARDGFPLAGEGHYALVSGVRSDYNGCLIKVWLVRHGIEIDPGTREALIARGERIYSSLLEKVPPPGTPSPFSEAEYLSEPENPPKRFPVPIRTATVGDLLALLASISSNRERREYLAMLPHLGELAAKDPMLRDRLLQIVEEGWGADVRQIAIFVLGITGLPEVRARLLDFVESEDLDLDLRVTALQATYMSRGQGVGETEGRIASWLEPIHDPAALERVLALSERTDLPRKLMTHALLPALGESQRSYPPGVDNPFSRRLRDLCSGLDDPEMARLAVYGLGRFPSEANFGFMSEMYLGLADWDEEGVKDALLGNFHVVGVKDLTLMRSLNRTLLDLASRTPTLAERARIFEKLDAASIDQDRLLALAREGLFGAMRPQDHPEAESRIRMAFITNMDIAVLSADETFIARARALLVEAKPHFAGNPELASLIERRITRLDRTIESMRERAEQREALDKARSEFERQRFPR